MADPAQLFGLIALQNVILASLVLGIFWGGVLIFRLLGRNYSYSLGALGVRRPAGSTGVSALKGLSAGFGLFLLSLPIFGVTAWVFRQFGYEADNSAQQPIFDAIEQWIIQGSALTILGAVLVVAVMTPVAEELLSRGAIFGGLRWAGHAFFSRLAFDKGASSSRLFVTITAAVVSSLIFAAIHFSPVIFPGLFVVAMAFCWLYARSGSLLPPILAHGAFNFSSMMAATLGSALT